MTTTSPSETSREEVLLRLETWRLEASQAILNSQLIADIVFQWAWDSLSRQAKEQGVTLRGKQQLQDEIVGKVLQYLTDVDGRVQKLIQGK